MILEFQDMETKATLKQIGCENSSLFANILLWGVLLPDI